MALTPVDDVSIFLILVQRRSVRGVLLRTFEDPDSGGEVVNAAGGLEGSGENLNRGDEIVSEAVVQVALFAGALVICRIGADIEAAC